MKLPVNNITTFARDVFTRKKRPTEQRMINPRRDWLIGLLCGVGILIGIMAWSAYMYVTNRSGENFQTEETSTTVPVYRAAAVADALDIFKQKQAIFDGLLGQVVQTPPPVTDSGLADTQDTNEEVVEVVATSSSPVGEEGQTQVTAEDVDTNEGSEEEDINDTTPELEPTLSE